MEPVYTRSMDIGLSKSKDKKRKEFGEVCENLACTYLGERGYKIIKRHYRYKKGEIDIIAQKKYVLVFVEVKGRTNIYYGMPESFVDEKKEDLVVATADYYIHETDWQGDIRFDIISVVFCKKLKEYIIDHFRDAFY